MESDPKGAPVCSGYSPEKFGRAVFAALRGEREVCPSLGPGKPRAFGPALYPQTLRAGGGHAVPNSKKDKEAGVIRWIVSRHKD